MTPIKSVVLFTIIAIGFTSCSPWQTANVRHLEPSVEMEQIGENEYELRIYDAGFSKWFAKHAFPVNVHAPEFYDEQNRQYAAIWNEKAANKQFSLINTPVRTPLDYDPTIDYGPEIDYLLFNYFQYVEFRYGRLLKTAKYASTHNAGNDSTATSRK